MGKEYHREKFIQPKVLEKRKAEYEGTNERKYRKK